MKRKTSARYFIKLRSASNRRRERVLLLFFLASVCVSTIYAKTAAQYREKLNEANVLIESLIYADEEEMSPSEYKNYERRALAQIRCDILASERVETATATIETDNNWLISKLDEFEKQPENSPKRLEILNEIGERLTAIRQKLNELEKPASNVARTKDEDKRKLAEILRREEFVKPEASESYFAKTWRRFKQWLNAKFPQPDIKPTDASAGFGWLSGIFQILLYALVAGAVGFSIYRFAPVIAEKFKRRERRVKTERVILGETLAENADAQNLFAEAERLAQSGNLRGAIRKGYVALLCELSDRKIIGLERHKTNRDYLRDVRKRGAIFEDVNGLTVNFERHWYGFEAVEEKDWNEFKDGYKKVVSPKSL